MNPSPSPSLRGRGILDGVGDDFPHPCQTLRRENLRRHPGVVDTRHPVADRAATAFRIRPIAANLRTLLNDLPAGRQVLGTLQAAHTPSMFE